MPKTIESSSINDALRSSGIKTCEIDERYNFTYHTPHQVLAHLQRVIDLHYSDTQDNRKLLRKVVSQFLKAMEVKIPVVHRKVKYTSDEIPSTFHFGTVPVAFHERKLIIGNKPVPTWQRSRDFDDEEEYWQHMKAERALYPNVPAKFYYQKYLPKMAS